MNLHYELNQFTGTENYYQHWLAFKYTDGVKYLAEKSNAYWLLDAIGSYQSFLKKIDFQIWELNVTDQKAVLTMKQDSGEPEEVNQKIEYTDFPMDYIKLYLINGVLLLPSEY